MNQSNEYWTCLKESMPDGVDIRTPCVLIEGEDDPTKDYFELPCLSMSFMSDEDYVPGKYDTSTDPNQKKKRRTDQNPEIKFLRLKRKFKFEDPKSLIVKEDASPLDDILIAGLCQTRLSGSGSNKKIRVDVCIPRIELSELIQEEVSRSCIENTNSGILCF